ncbi:MAG: zinc-ribbon domain-containing protein, partial [Lachnospiraceae bacterium]|nr:zinc-ribbon domain-containing protein [Lachnospiraceae bacterium]
MAFCSNCGAPISEGTKFCPECGQRIETPEPVNTAPEQGEYQSTYTAPEQGEYQSAYTAPEQGECQSAYTEPEQGEYQSSYRAPEQGEYQSSYVPPQQNAPLAGQKKSMNINPKLLIGAAAAVVLLLVLFLVLGGKKKPENSGSTGSDTGVTAPSVPGETENAESGGITDLQKQWNGTWYGCMYVSEATGDFAGIPDKYYDVYMVVEVDGQGKGQFAVYLAGVEEAFALADCEAKAEGLYATEGTVAGGVDMDTYNWMFLPMPDYPDQYAMGDVIEDGDSVFDFKLFVKQWGGSWQDEIDSDFAIVPPSVDRYMAAIADGELPPVGFAPIEYEGTNPASADGGDILDK